jgi:autotransporter-associated beta strand protein
LPALVFILPNQISQAGSATWNLNPTSGEWNTATNWTPNTVPNGPADTASFDVSNTTGISLSRHTLVNSIVFDPAASAFAITANPAVYFDVTGAGITNNSGNTQNFVTGVDPAGNRGIITFHNGATVGSGIVFTNPGGLIPTNGGSIYFFDASSAGSAMFVNGGGVNINGQGGSTDFYDNSTAAHGTFVNNGGAANGAEGGITIIFGTATAGDGTFITNGGSAGGAQGGIMQFSISATAGNGTFVSNGGEVLAAGGGITEFLVSSTAGDASFTNNGGAVDGADGAVMHLIDTSTAGNATLIANGGPGADTGAVIHFSDNSSGGAARVELFGNGNLDISDHDAPGVTIGSIEGNGLVFLGANDLSVGNNNLSTRFSGVISGDGSVVKLGHGRLVLAGANTYTGGTTIAGGKLVISNTIGSGTGSGPVQVNGGRLTGRGTIAGAVTIGKGSGPGAILSPGTRGANPGVLTTQSTLLFNADGIYNCGLNSSSATADEVIANGVTITSGAVFASADFGATVLQPGTVFTVISNTAVTPISGTFSNLSDGSTLTVGANTFEANYEGGDGNDLTLKVVP